MSKSPLVYLITVNWNGKNDTLEFLKSAYQSSYSNLKILVVDNNSADNSVNEIKLRYPDTEILRSETNTGASGGFNLGIKASLKFKSDFSFLCNNDVVLDKDCIKELVSFALKKNSPIIVVPKIYLYGTKRFYTAGAPSIYTVFGTRGWGRSDTGQYDKTEKLSWALGTGMLVDNRIFEEIGLFDEDYFIYHEDYDLTRRVINGGYDIWYYPKAVMWHKSKQSIGILSRTWVYYSTRNILLAGKKVDEGGKRLFNYLFTFIKLPFILLATLFKLDYKLLKCYFRGIVDYYNGVYGKVREL